MARRDRTGTGVSVLVSLPAYGASRRECMCGAVRGARRSCPVLGFRVLMVCSWCAHGCLTCKGAKPSSCL